jgi:oligopeptide transport system ATP-binding protein
MTSAAEILLSVRDLEVSYPRRGKSSLPLTAVRGVSLDIQPASIYALAGESGSGKSTLAHAIVGLTPTTGGQVLFRGKDLATMEAAQRKSMRQNIQLIFQDALSSLSPRRSILQSLLEPLDHFRLGEPSSRVDRAVQILETVGLDTALRHRYPNEISGGQRQRVALARALVAEPELVIADEPLSSLDVPVQSRMIDLILELREKLGVAFLFVSHDLSTVYRLADTVGVMYLGKVVESASVETLFNRPAHPYTRSLMASVPVADPRHARPTVLGGDPPSPLTPPTGCAFHMRCPDKIAVCSSIVPGESAIGEPDGTVDGNQELKSTGHRVKCHLWNATNS